MMRKAIALAALFFCAPAFAGLSIVYGSSAQSSSSLSAALSGSMGPGQVILACVQGSPASSLTVSDNVNSGNYSLLQSYSAPFMAIFWKITTATGTPTVTVTGLTGYTYLWDMGVIGFVGTPTADTAIENTATGTGTTLSINAASNFANEVMLVCAGDSYTQKVTLGSGWANGTGVPLDYTEFYAIEASPATNNFSGTWGTSQTWYLQLVGIYDAGSSSSHSAGFFLSMQFYKSQRYISAPRIIRIVETHDR